MKRYIRAAVSIENLRTQFAPDMTDDKFRQLISLDPSADFEKNRGGKYCPWIFRQDKKGNLTEADYTNLKDALDYFMVNYKKYPKSDLGQYKTIEEFLQDTEAVGNRELTDKEKAKMLKKQAHHASDEDKKFLVEDGDWEVWQPLTYAGSISLARQGGTKASWCTAYEGDDHWYQRYTRKGPLYIFLNTKDPHQKYQLHFETDSWYDINDNQKWMPAFYAFCGEHPAIAEFFNVKNDNGVLSRADSIVGYEETKEITIPDTISALPDIDFPDCVEKIILPDSITKLYERRFEGLRNLKEIKLPSAIKQIPRECFKDCTALEHIDIPDSVLVYRANAFYNCSSLKSIKHSSNLVSVEEDCFWSCEALETQLPDSVTYIGKTIFNGTNIADIVIPAGVSSLVSSGFASSSIKSVNLNEVNNIAMKCFKDSSVEKINLDKVSYIGPSAFRDCINLKSIELNPSGVKVGSHAFANSGLNGTVTIYPTTELSLSVFDDCKDLTIKWEAEDQPYELDGIKLLICSKGKCPDLINANRGYIKIETTEGDVYEVQ